MEARQENLFRIITGEYIQSACPVGSGLVVEKYFPELSSATVRNDMAELEEKGLIFQPHVSAGRIPTLEGYRYYVENFVGEGDLNEDNKNKLQQLNSQLEFDRESIKKLAKELAELSQEAIVVGFSPLDVFYTGISNLFAQEEFKQAELVVDVSTVIDQMDEIIDKIFNKLSLGAQVLIGPQNPFGDFLSTVLVKYNWQNQSGIFGILGPLRMDYEKNIALANYIKNKMGE